MAQCSIDLMAKAGCGIKAYSSNDSNAPPLQEQYLQGEGRRGSGQERREREKE